MQNPAPSRGLQILALIPVLGMIYLLGTEFAFSNSNDSIGIIPDEVELPFKWGDLGKQMMEEGVIDQEKFTALYTERGGMNEWQKELLEGSDGKELAVTQENAPFLLNMLWALGLSNKNPILEEGPMVDEKYGGTGGFASTGGWDLATGDSMDHYSTHTFITLTQEQQARVEEVSKNIFRPCCDNSTYFPDCNHGMAMLGLLELLAAEDLDEEEMYEIALQINVYWFPGTYENIALYLKQEGQSWKKVDPKEILGQNYSSSSGYKNVVSNLESFSDSGGAGGCST